MKVLIVDDKEEICKGLQQELRKEGYKVDYTTSSVGVLEKLKEAKEKSKAYELLLLDLRMPEIDGLTLLKKIREALSDLDVIIITGYGDENNAIESIRLGAIDYLRKPISLEELRTAIFRVQQKRAAEEKKALEWSILVVDDEKDLCEHIKRELDKEGYQVAVAYDGAEGLDYFKNNRADVVLADIKMPRLSGLEMLEKCRAITDDFVSIIITGHGDYEKPIEALKLGVFDYLKKPISLDELIISVTKGIDLLTLRRSLSARKRELELERALKELLVLYLQQQQQQQQQILNMILGLAADGISIVDMEFNIILVNETFAKMSGISKEDAVGKKCYEVFSGEFCHTGRCSLTQILKGHAYLEEESKMESADGTKIPCLVVAKPYKSIDGELVGVMEDFRDISKRKRAEEELKNAYHELKDTHAQLLQAGKMTAMGEMAAGVAHELTQPLLGIKGFATALLEDARRMLNADFGMRNEPNAELESALRIPHSAFPPRAVADLEVILQQIDRMTKIVNMVRDFARTSGTEMALLEINKSIENALMLFSEQLRLHNIVLEKNLAQGLPHVMGNANQLQQVFINLITNARDAMDAKGGEGRLTVSTGVSPTDDAILIEFADSGIGVDAETLSRMFEPFFTTKNTGKGIGLGLSIVDRIIKEHDGTTDVESRPGGGCKFTIRLPLGGGNEGESARRRNGETARGRIGKKKKG